jgi:excisionase family DNA binding protein
MTTARFLTIDQVAEELATSRAQIYALLKRRDLVGIKIGGRGQWRVERSKLEEYLERTYAETDAWLDKHADELGGAEE